MTSASPELAPPALFGDLLAARVEARESQLVLGLDPDPADLWPQAGAASQSGSAHERAAAAVRAHCEALIDAVGPACVAVKLQLACFERLGGPGGHVLVQVAERARNDGLLVIADGKRGDISVSAQAYAQALFNGLDTPWGHVRGLGVDLATVNPLMGADAVEPFVTVARQVGAGVLLLVRTSNPGAADVLDAGLIDGRPLWEHLAELAHQQGLAGVGASGLSDVGAVVGATAPEHLGRLRELMPRAVFLLPGVGAQGGKVENLAAAFAPGRAAGLISASRGIAGAAGAGTADPAMSARAEAERLRDAAWSLR